MDPTERKERNGFLYSYQTSQDRVKQKDIEKMNKIKSDLFKAIKVI